VKTGQTGMENWSYWFHLSILVPICRISILNEPFRPVLSTGQTGMCVQKPILAILSSFILIFGLFLFLMTYACMVHLFSQERQLSCPLEVHPPNFMRVARRVDVMSTLVKGIKKSSTSKNIQEDSA
jgi:hypothetical protein